MGKDKHSPYTSEYSMPHHSKDCPEEHVDLIHFDKDGEPDHRMVIHHITDPDAIKMGQETYEFHQQKKEEEDKKK